MTLSAEAAPPSERRPSDVLAVRMGMTVPEGERLSAILLRLKGDLQPVADRIHEQLWLRCVLIEQRRRVHVAERASFDQRADQLLELLDPQEPNSNVTDADWRERPSMYVGRRQRHRNTGSVWVVESIASNAKLNIRCERGGGGEEAGTRRLVWPEYLLNAADWELLNR